jgi:hypothetical protein
MTYNCLGLNRTLYTVLFLVSVMASSVTLGSVVVGFDKLASGYTVSHKI